MKKIIALGILVFLLIPLASALEFDGVYFQPSGSNTTYLINSTLDIDNVSVNSTHLGIDNRNINLESGDNRSVEVTNVQTASDLTGDTLYTITYKILGALDTQINLTYIADFVYGVGTSIDGIVFLTNYFNFTGTQGIFRAYELQSFNFEFYDELTSTLLNTTNISLEIISDEASFEYAVTTGNQSVSLPNTPGIYTLRYDAAGYEERLYNFVIADQTSETIKFYLLNESSSDLISVRVVDQDGAPVENALVKVLKYNVTTNSYNIIESAGTNYDGYMVFDGVLNAEYYKFIVEYPSGTTRKITSPTYLLSTSLEIKINIAEDVLEEFENKQQISVSFFYNEDTENLHFTWNDPNALTTNGCIELYGLRGSGEYLLNTTCTSGDAATLLLALTNESYDYDDYRGDAYLTISGDYTYQQSEYVQFAPDIQDDEDFLIYVVLLTIPVFLIFLFSPAIAVSLLPSPMLMFSIIGLTPVEWYIILPIQLVFIGLGVFIGNRG